MVLNGQLFYDYVKLIYLKIDTAIPHMLCDFLIQLLKNNNLFLQVFLSCRFQSTWNVGVYRLLNLKFISEKYQSISSRFSFFVGSKVFWNLCCKYIIESEVWFQNVFGLIPKRWRLRCWNVFPADKLWFAMH